MPLPKDYMGQNCSVARSLEVVGERWTLLIIRDAFYGVRRFSDFIAHLDIPRAVLTARLGTLVEEGVMAKVPGAGRREEYELTDKGLSLWPLMRALMAWGDEHYAPGGPRRVMRHVDDGGLLDRQGRCAECGELVGVDATRMETGPGFDWEGRRTDPISAAILDGHRMLDPVRA